MMEKSCPDLYLFFWGINSACVRRLGGPIFECESNSGGKNPNIYFISLAGRGGSGDECVRDIKQICADFGE